MIFNRFLFSVLVLATVLLQPPHASAAGEGKFHLVYLVSAVDLKPGSKIYVDPIFFTDGKEVKNFHDYCAAKETPSRLVADLKLLKDYCAHKSFTLNAKDFHTLNNHGQQIAVDHVEFNVAGEVVIPPDVEHQSESEIKAPVMMGQSEILSFTPGTIEVPRWLRNDGAPEYFFLMSRKKQVLEKIVPVARVAQPDVDALTKRAVDFSKIAKWRRAGIPVHLKDIEKAQLCYDVTKPVVFRMENPLIIDLDADGSLDMYVNVYATVKLEQEPEQPLVDCFPTYSVLGNGDAVLYGSWDGVWPQTSWKKSSWEEGVYHRYLQNGYPVHTNLIAVRRVEQNRACTYVLKYYTGYLQYPQGYLMTSVNCKKSYVFSKHEHPSVKKGYHTFNDNPEFERALYKRVSSVPIVSTLIP